MRIAIVSPYSWTAPGGANNQIEGSAAVLRERGHDVLILAPADGPVPEGVHALGRSVGIPFNGSVARLAFGPRVALRLRRELRAFRPDVVHVHEPFSPSASMLAVLVSDVPIVATFHAQVQSRLYAAGARLLRRLWRKLDARVAVSEAARETVERIFGPGIRVIPNAVDTARDAAIPDPDPNAEPIVLFWGRLEPRKGVRALIDAVPWLVEVVPDVTVVIAGDGALRSELEQRLVPEHRARVRFEDAPDDERRSALLAEAIVCCFPAIGGESFGVVLIEAMAAGRPVVASRIPGFAAVCRDGIDGWLVPPGDAAALGGTLARVLRDRGEIARASAAARERAATFDRRTVIQQVEALYHEVLASS